MGAKGNSGAAAPRAETRKSTAAMISPRLRPIRVLTQPPMRPPMMQPMSALETTKPQQGVGGVGLSGIGEIGESGIDEIRFQTVDRAVDDGRVVAEE
jgi:hypothetical protein